MSNASSRRTFLEEIGKLAQNFRLQIEAEVDGFDPDPAAMTARRAQSMRDYRFFARTYFPHYIKHAEAALHTYLYDRLPEIVDNGEGDHEAIAAPRGNAKSTLVTQIFVIWCIVTGRKQYPLIVMDALDQAATMLEAIKAELAFNPRLAMDFPEASGGGRVWQVGTIITANDVKVQAFGSGKRMRGLRHGPHRPDLVIGDDLENDENVRSPDQRDKLENWLKKTVLSLGAADDSMDVIIIGTILHYDSVLSRLLKNPLWTSKKFKSIERWPDNMQLWDEWEGILLNGRLTFAQENFIQAARGVKSWKQWSEKVDPIGKTAILHSDVAKLNIERAKTKLALAESEIAENQSLRLLIGGEPTALNMARAFYEAHKLEMDAGAVVCWPEGQPLYKLMVKRARDGRAAFDSEQQNDPVSGDDAPFANCINFWVNRLKEWVFYGACDPSLGKAGASRDPSALGIGGFNRHTGVLDVVEAAIKKRLPDRIIEDIIAMQAEYKCVLWVVETIQFQEFLKTELVKRSAARGIPVPARGVQPHTDKLLRIETLQPHMANSLIRLHPSQTTLIDQFRHFPKADHDDGPDMVHMLWMAAISGSNKIEYQSAGGTRRDDDGGRKAW